MAGFLDEIEPLKQTALAELKAAPDLAALEQTKGMWIGPNGKFTALMKQLGTLSKEEKPAAGKLINVAKVELEAALAERRSELELAAALPKHPTDFTLPGRRRALGKLHPLTQVTDDIVRAFTRILQKQGLKIEVGAKVTGYANGVLTAERGTEKLSFPADKVLVAVGRRPFTDSLNLAAAGVQLDEKKRVKVDAHLKTNVPGIWALGDVVAGPMLAHKAEEDGVAVAEWIAQKAGHVNWDLIPAIVYTDPEVASIGLGEDAAKAAGLAINVGKFNFAANGRALANDATDGFVKIIADAKTDKILGAQIVGKGAGELISEIVTHMEYGGSAEDLARTVHAHPTMSEAVKEAALAVAKRALHAM